MKTDPKSERQFLREVEAGEWKAAKLSATARKLYADAARDSLHKAAHFDLDESQRAELDRRWKAHLAEPAGDIAWDDLQRSLRSRK
ncbi:MAG: hypothetical protein ACRD0Y_04635 [Terriglobales bacterium]